MATARRRWLPRIALTADTVAGAAGVGFAWTHLEWAPFPVAAGWLGLCLFAFLHDRQLRSAGRWSARAALAAVVVQGVALALAALDRAAPQVAVIADGPEMRGTASILVFAAVATVFGVLASSAHHATVADPGVESD
ncbi:MAG: hypothetical protein ABEL76_14925 [Bradymonadaceae bacterium]